MSIHHFDTEVAKRVGIPAACVAYCIKFWCQHKAANGKDIYDGKAWVYNSAKAWSELIDYMTEKQIRTALDKLKDAGIIAVRNLNQKQYDQTLWYAYLELEPAANTANCPNGKMGFPNGQMEMPEREDGFAQMGRPIPVEIPNLIPSKADAFVSASAPTPKSPEQPNPQKGKGKVRGTERGSRISENWSPTVKDLAFAAKHSLTREEINREADRFRNHWLAARGDKGVKRDWEATWRNWLIGDYGIVTKREQARAANNRRGAEQTLSAFDRVAASLAGHAPRPADPVQPDAGTIEGEYWPAETRTGTRG